MSANTIGTTFYEGQCTPTGDGLKVACGTADGTGSYDTGGSVLDLSSVFASKVHFCIATTNNADFSAKWVPGTSNASSDMKLFVDNDAGTEATSTDVHSTTPGTWYWYAIGTDG